MRDGVEQRRKTKVRKIRERMREKIEKGGSTKSFRDSAE